MAETICWKVVVVVGSRTSKVIHMCMHTAQQEEYRKVEGKANGGTGVA